MSQTTMKIKYLVSVIREFDNPEEASFYAEQQLEANDNIKVKISKKEVN